MKADVFKNFDPFSKQKLIAKFFLARLQSLAVAEHPCHDYASARQLAHMVSRFDNENLCAQVHIYSTYVKIIRNEKGGFAFPCSVLDHVQKIVDIQEG